MTAPPKLATSPQFSRRKALSAAGVGALASASALVSGPRSSLAQGSNSTESGERIGHLFILVASEGTLLPADDGLFELVLTDLGEHVLFYTDPPDQRSDFIDIDTALAQIALDVDHCNAGLALATDDHRNEPLALELRSVSYDPSTRTATFATNLLNGFHPTAWKSGFFAATLVVDDALAIENN